MNVEPPRALAALLAALLLGPGCPSDAPCEEDPRAQVLDQGTRRIDVGGQPLEVEVADDAVERERGWRHRVCGREGLLLLPDAPPEPLPLWGCELAAPVHVVSIRDGSVTAVERLEPCPPPCSSCPLVGQGEVVDAMLELADNMPAPEVGALVTGL